MANTEGLPDEALSSLLSLSREDERANHRSVSAGSSNVADGEAPRFPRKYLARREQMMELGEGEEPAAKVIRSSKPPVVRSSGSSAKKSGTAEYKKSSASDVPAAPSQLDALGEHDGNRFEDVQDAKAVSNQTNSNHKPVILSESIRERPLKLDSANDVQTSSQSTGRKESRFKQRNRNKDVAAPTSGGFPSLDFAPVGSLTRKGRATRSRHPSVTNYVDKIPRPDPAAFIAAPAQAVNNERSGIEVAAKSMLASMSLDEIRDGIDEITSILSPESIEFLRNRSKKKMASTVSNTKQQKKAETSSKEATPTRSQNGLSKEAQLELEEQKAREDKEKTARILSSVRTPEDLDQAFNEALNLGLATELPASTLQHGISTNDTEGQDISSSGDIAMLTSLLRSTALRQRLLGVKGLCSILKAKVEDLIESRRKGSYCYNKKAHNEAEFPLLLPVALRCLLDDSIGISHTAVGCSLLSTTLQCIQYLLMLFVHPYHLVCDIMTKIETKDCDPFIVNQTCFMSEISHIPGGNELYPPTIIEPIGDEGVKKGCYRADSSAASADSDSKAFYNDPAWTLLSRMRIIPCLSDALVCLSKHTSTDATISSEPSISSICGILSLLSVRSPGVADAIAGHKVLLPLIISRSLSPNLNETSSSDGSSVFQANLALPALNLLVILAQQSRDIAELTVFENVVTDLQAILCLNDPDKCEVELQIWSLILIRTLLRYGLASNHAQSLIHLSAVQMTHLKSNVGLHYLALFSRLCDFAKTRLVTVSNALETIQEDESDNDIVLLGVWLSSLANGTVISIQQAIQEFSSTTNKQRQLASMKLLAAELDFLSSYMSVTYSSNCNPVREEMKSSFVPTITAESCGAVHDAVFNSQLLECASLTALAWACRADWYVTNENDGIVKYEDEATACRLVASIMRFDAVATEEGGLNQDSFATTIKVLQKVSIRNKSTSDSKTLMHPSRKSWLIEAEFSVLQFLCRNQARVDSRLISTFAFSLLGRLPIGDEALASFIFQQDYLFQADDATHGSTWIKSSHATSIQNTFLSELGSSPERKAQLLHSSALHTNKMQTHEHLTSLRSGSSFGGKAEHAYLLPLGGIWLWNVLSSTTTDSAAINEEAQPVQSTVDVLSHALDLALRSDTDTISDGTKLYHISNICLYPEAILRDGFVQDATNMLYERFVVTSTNRNFVRDFISACHNHSRISRARVQGTGATDDATAVRNEHNIASAEELRALDDFVSDICDCYIEYGAQYEVATRFIRFFLRHEFPTAVTSSVLSKLHPILNNLTLEEDASTTSSSLMQSVSGGLPSKDGSRRDHSDVLDSFSNVLKKRDRELSRCDYIYLLAISVLSRNLSSSSQRCECGVEAMKHRLLGIQESVLYDIIKVCEQFLRGEGSKHSLITCVTEQCLDEKSMLSMQDECVQSEWNWNAGNKELLWEKAMSSINAGE
ncbi:hypothetical protein ACHAXN_012586 [Cyclotella atomus]